VKVAVVDQGDLAPGELSKADWSSEEWEAFRDR
jgi:hypothetical protein